MMSSSRKKKPENLFIFHFLTSFFVQISLIMAHTGGCKMMLNTSNCIAIYRIVVENPNIIKLLSYESNVHFGKWFFQNWMQSVIVLCIIALDCKLNLWTVFMRCLHRKWLNFIYNLSNGNRLSACWCARKTNAYAQINWYNTQRDHTLLASAWMENRISVVLQQVIHHEIM